MRFLHISIAASLLIACVALALAMRTNRSVPDLGSTSVTRSTDSDLSERVDRLEKTLARIEERLAAQPTATTNATPIASKNAESMETRVSVLEERVALWAESQGPLVGEVSMRDLERTRQALTEIQRDDMTAQVSRWVERERERANQLVSTLSARMNLTAEESDMLAKIFASESEAQAQMLDDLWTSEPPEDATEQQFLAERWDAATIKMKELRSERDAGIEELLGDERFQEFQKLARKKKPQR